MLILILITLISISPAFSQITISSDAIPLDGVTYVLHHAEHEIEVDNGNPGPNQIWNFLDYNWIDEEYNEIVEPEHSPFVTDFPEASRAIYISTEERHGEGSYYFERIADDGVFTLGFGNVTDSDTTAYPYVGESFQCLLPLSYPSESWTTVERWWFSVNPGDTVVVVDSLINTVDGWGTVVTEFGNYECLRIFHHDWLFTYLPGAPPVEIEQVGYRWLDENCALRADVVSEADVTDPEFSIGHLHVISNLAESVSPHRGPVAHSFGVEQNYPNPFNPTTSLPVKVQTSGEISLKIYNENGQLISEQTFSLSPGQHELPIDGSNWSTGTYFANVSESGRQLTTKMQLIK